MILINYTIKPKTEKKILGIISAFLTLIVPLFLLFNNNNNHLETAQSYCPFKMLTGFPCPGCGITKSLVFLYEGNLLKSISYHLFGPLLVLFCVFIIVLLSAELFTKKEYFNYLFYNKKLAYFLASVLIIYHLSRLVIFVDNNTIDMVIKQSIWR